MVWGWLTWLKTISGIHPAMIQQPTWSNYVYFRQRSWLFLDREQSTLNLDEYISLQREQQILVSKLILTMPKRDKRYSVPDFTCMTSSFIYSDKDSLYFREKGHNSILNIYNMVKRNTAIHLFLILLCFFFFWITTVCI